jgi:hypothetical protein
VKYWFPALGAPVTPVHKPAELKLLLPDASPPLNVAVPSANAAGAASRVRIASTTKRNHPRRFKTDGGFENIEWIVDEVFIRLLIVWDLLLLGVEFCKITFTRPFESKGCKQNATTVVETAIRRP